MTIAMAQSPVLKAGPIEIEYKLVDTTSADAQQIWGDLLPTARLMNGGKPAVNVATYKTENGSKLRISTIYSSDVCDVNSCPVRVWEDDKQIDEFRACDNITMHWIAESQRAMVACDDVFIIHRKK
jgi:hypothetical protein